MIRPNACAVVLLTESPKPEAEDQALDIADECVALELPPGPLSDGMQLCVCALSAISGFLFGYDLCVMIVALPLIQTVGSALALLSMAQPYANQFRAIADSASSSRPKRPSAS